MRTLIAALAVALAAVIIPTQPAPAPVTSTAAASTTCSTLWGSLPEGQLTLAGGEIDALRAGRHDCYDRLVIQVDGPAGGRRAQYVDQVTADGSGNVVPTPGGARIQLIVGHPAYSLGPVGGRLVSVAGFDTLRSVVNAGSFEGQTTIGVGTRARLPFRVFSLAGPGGQSRIVLDVAHRWTS